MQANAFLKIFDTFFNHVASTGCPVATGNCLLHYMYSGKKKPQNMSLQPFYTHFQNALHAVKLLDHCHEKDLDNNKSKIIFFYSFPKEHIQDHVYYSNCDFDSETLEDLQNFFQGHYYANPPKKTHPQNKQCNNKGHTSHCICVAFTPCDVDNTMPMSTTIPSCCSSNQPCNQSHSGQQCDASLPQMRNQCGFCKDTHTKE